MHNIVPFFKIAQERTLSPNFGEAGGWIIFFILMGIIAINMIDMGRVKGRHE